MFMQDLEFDFRCFKNSYNHFQKVFVQYDDIYKHRGYKISKNKTTRTLQLIIVNGIDFLVMNFKKTFSIMSS